MILVTGGAGFIGRHLVRALRDRGETVDVLDSLELQVHGAVPDAVGWVDHFMDVRNAGLLALNSYDAIVHLAAVVGVGQSMYEPARYVRRNTLSTAFLMEALAKQQWQGRLIVASSMSIYGEGSYACSDHGFIIHAPTTRPLAQLQEGRWELLCPRCRCELAPRSTTEDKALLPTSAYAITKRDQEELCLQLGSALDIPTVALRFFNVYGPEQALSNPYTGVAAIFASSFMRGEKPRIFEDGQQSRDFIHVSDIVAGIIGALDSDVSGEAINLGTGIARSVADIAVAVGPEGLREAVSDLVTGEYRMGDIRHCWADTRKAQRLLGWKATKSFDEGMREYGLWLASAITPYVVPDAYGELRERGMLL